MKNRSTFTIAAACTAALVMFGGSALAQSPSEMNLKPEQYKEVHIVESPVGPLRVTIEEVAKLDPASMTGYTADRLLQGLPVRAAAAAAEGGVAGECDGICGTIAPSGCGCDIECHAWDDCCADVCDDCSALPGCANPTGDVLYSELTGFTGSVFFPDGNVFADNVTIVGDAPVDIGLAAFTFANLDGVAGAPPGSPMTRLAVRVHFWETTVPPFATPVMGGELVPPIEFEVEPDEPFAVNTLFIVVITPEEPETVLAAGGTKRMFAGMAFRPAPDSEWEGAGSLDHLAVGLYAAPQAIGSKVTNLFFLQGFGLASFTDGPGGPPLPFNLGVQLQRADVFRPCCGGEVAPPCPADIAPPGGNGVVNVFDLLELLAQWGPCPTPPDDCPADIAPPGGNGVVNVFDLLELLAQWGPCPTAGGAASAGCDVMPVSECADLEGDSLGISGTTCDWPDICAMDAEDPDTWTGACCLVTGCELRTEASCAADLGTWQGAFVDCPSICGAPLTCPSGATNEAEDCGDNENGGCTIDPENPLDHVESIDCGGEICGTWWVDDSTTRDTDWYVYENTSFEPHVLQWCVEAEWPVLVQIVELDENDECTDSVVLAGATGPANTNVCVTAPINPFGNEVVLVTAPLFLGDLPCNSAVGNKYIATLTCLGSCGPGAAQCGFSNLGDDLCSCEPACVAFGNCCLDYCLNCFGGADMAAHSSCAGSTPDSESNPVTFCDLGASYCAALFGPGDDRCFCDEDCCLFEDCCDDKLAECGGCDPDATCEGFCGAQAPSGCWCNEDCCDNADCCPDKFDECGGCSPLCGLAGSGDCCAANGTPGCEDADCCNAVCDCDPFCCNVEWDGFCASTGFDDDCLCGPGECGALNTAECASLCGSASLGACCVGNVCDDDVDVADCQDDFGHFWATDSCGAVSCPDCGGDYTQDWTEFTTGATSDVDAQFSRYDLIPDPLNVSTLHVWGIRAFFDGTAWGGCTASSDTFNVRMYEDDNGQPGTLVCEHLNVVANAVDTGVPFGGIGNVIRFEFALSGCNGARWISVEGNSGADNCWFLWLNSHGGNGSSLLEDLDEMTIAPVDMNLSLCVNP